MKGEVPKNYIRCVTCPILDEGKCGAPNVATWTSQGCMAFISARAKYLGLSHKAMAERANLPLGTVDGVLSGASPNPKMDTLRSLLLSVGVVDAEATPCPDPGVITAQTEEIAALERKLRKANAALEKATAELDKADSNAQRKVDHLKGEIDFLRTNLSHKEKLNKILMLAIIIIFAAWFLVELVFPDVGFIRY